MKFELNDYHRNVPDEDFIKDIQETAKRLGKTTLTGEEYAAHGKYHPSTLRRRFGTWKDVLEKSGLETNGHNFRLSYTDDEVISDLKRVATILGKETITREEYDSLGKISCATLVKPKHYGSWNAILKLTGMEPNLNRNFTNEEMYEEIERIWILLGRQPTTTDIKKGISKFSLQSYARRFGGWRGALQAFVDYINNEDANASDESQMQEHHPEKITEEVLIRKNIPVSHSTNRDINLRLRFKVMQRDNFKCCACGASPAKDPAVELHIDHIIPWAKGGETVIDNLQTLCSKCNLGKSDIL